DLLEDFVHGGIRILFGRFRIMHLEPRPRLQFRKGGAAGEQSLQPYPRLKIQKRKQCAPNVAGESDVRTIGGGPVYGAEDIATEPDDYEHPSRDRQHTPDV